ncbi:murein transglycosylase [Ameyamaea chiangmaiensis NBRC 103196]|nr:lytic transglycosylase domain-containing protein [Ameyamaea chiangmaiensis]GBQ61664.1 murein transglycosylase [Ameyamaea chiangmaiensis NBRC 103196]
MKTALRLCVLGGLASLGACSGTPGSGGSASYGRYYEANRAYPAPGPANDPWGPYIRQAARRFSFPDQWIRAVIQQESGGHEYLNGHLTTSGAGAMGLMQLMPATYAEMQQRFSLGPDPYDPRDNILAGTGYLNLLYAKYGAPGFLAAYNAGPARLDDYLATGRDLPNETVNYVASITPNLGTQAPLSGPLAAYASNEPSSTPSVASAPSYAPPPSDQNAPQYAQATSTDQLNAASAEGDLPADGAAPTSLPAYTPPPAAAPAPQAPPMGAPLPPPQATAAPPLSIQAGAAPTLNTPTKTGIQVTGFRPSAAPVQVPDYGAWSVQVGAFAAQGQARFANTIARQAAFDDLSGAQSMVQTVSSGGRMLYRARLTGLSRAAAAHACSQMARQGLGCMAVPPGH